MSGRIVQFHSARLLRLSTSHWTMTTNLTRTAATRTPLFAKKTSHPHSQSALLLWSRHGPSMGAQGSLCFVMTKGLSGSGQRILLPQLTRKSHSNLKIPQYLQGKVMSCSTHSSSGPEFACPEIKTSP